MTVFHVTPETSLPEIEKTREFLMANSKPWLPLAADLAAAFEEIARLRKLLAEKTDG